MSNSPPFTQALPQEHQAMITMVSGPVLKARPASLFSMNELVEVGEERLAGEVISLDGELATIQVYENTSGISPGTPVHGLGLPLYVELGPGLVGTIFDGIQRPLQYLRQQWGNFIHRGRIGAPLDRERLWGFSPLLSIGEQVLEAIFWGR